MRVVLLQKPSIVLMCPFVKKGSRKCSIKYAPLSILTLWIFNTFRIWTVRPSLDYQKGQSSIEGVDWLEFGTKTFACALSRPFAYKRDCRVHLQPSVKASIKFTQPAKRFLSALDSGTMFRAGRVVSAISSLTRQQASNNNRSVILAIQKSYSSDTTNFDKLFPKHDTFAERHIGPVEAEKEAMLDAVGVQVSVYIFLNTYDWTVVLCKHYHQWSIRWCRKLNNAS